LPQQLQLLASVMIIALIFAHNQVTRASISSVISSLSLSLLQLLQLLASVLIERILLMNARSKFPLILLQLLGFSDTRLDGGNNFVSSAQVLATVATVECLG